MSTEQTPEQFRNSLYFPDSMRALVTAAGQLEAAAADLRRYAALAEESVDPSSITLAASISLPANLAGLAQGTQGYIRSANDSLFASMRAISHLRPTVEQPAP